MLPFAGRGRDNVHANRQISASYAHKRHDVPHFVSSDAKQKWSRKFRRPRVSLEKLKFPFQGNGSPQAAYVNYDGI